MGEEIRYDFFLVIKNRRILQNPIVNKMFKVDNFLIPLDFKKP